MGTLILLRVLLGVGYSCFRGEVSLYEHNEELLSTMLFIIELWFYFKVIRSVSSYSPSLSEKL